MFPFVSDVLTRSSMRKSWSIFVDLASQVLISCQRISECFVFKLNLFLFMLSERQLKMRDVTDADTCPRCQKCDRWRNAPEYIRDPWVLWDKFPCPPPGTPNKARLLIELDWTGRLGARDGCKALRRVASRCKVDLTSVELSAESLSDCDELFTVFGLCGTQCVIAIILACICLMFVFLLVIVCCRYV